MLDEWERSIITGLVQNTESDFGKNNTLQDFMILWSINQFPNMLASVIMILKLQLRKRVKDWCSWYTWYANNIEVSALQRNMYLRWKTITVPCEVVLMMWKLKFTYQIKCTRHTLRNVGQTDRNVATPFMIHVQSSTPVGKYVLLMWS